MVTTVCFIGVITIKQTVITAGLMQSSQNLDGINGIDGIFHSNNSVNSV